MDTSPEYRLMCEHKHVQERWHTARLGDIVCWTRDNHVIEVFNSIDTDSWSAEEAKAEGAVWFPRQDQLQVLCFETHCCTDPECLNMDFNKFLKRMQNTMVSDTFEKLWLQFFMRKRHEHKWNHVDNRWVRVPACCSTCDSIVKIWHRAFHTSNARFCSNPWHQT